jgi:Pvc16 N-terminal domain
MAGFRGVSATGRSIRRLLELRFRDEEPISGTPTSVAIVRTEDLDPTNLPALVSRPALTIFLYRVDFNKTMRAAWSGVGLNDGRSHLALDLHFLLTAWADNAENEHLILGRALQVIEDTPILAGPLLMQATDWAANESLQLVLEDIETEALMRIFDSLPVEYRLSVPYVARVTRIDGSRRPANQRDPDVVTAIVGARP